MLAQIGSTSCLKPMLAAGLWTSRGKTPERVLLIRGVAPCAVQGMIAALLSSAALDHAHQMQEPRVLLSLVVP